MTRIGESVDGRVRGVTAPMDLVIWKATTGQSVVREKIMIPADRPSGFVADLLETVVVRIVRTESGGQ